MGRRIPPGSVISPEAQVRGWARRVRLIPKMLSRLFDGPGDLSATEVRFIEELDGVVAAVNLPALDDRSVEVSRRADGRLLVSLPHRFETYQGIFVAFGASETTIDFALEDMSVSPDYFLSDAWPLDGGDYVGSVVMLIQRMLIGDVEVDISIRRFWLSKTTFLCSGTGRRTRIQKSFSVGGMADRSEQGSGTARSDFTVGR